MTIGGGSGSIARTPRTAGALVREAAGDIRAAIGMFDARAWLLAGVSALATAVVIGVPTEIIGNPWFTRMTPVRSQDYMVWAATALLAGLVAGTFARRVRGPSTEARVLSGGGLAYLAVGCPVCNKLVVLTLGTSGALTFFAPLQLYLGIASLALLLWTLRVRARSLVGSCAVAFDDQQAPP